MLPGPCSDLLSLTPRLVPAPLGAPLTFTRKDSEGFITPEDVAACTLTMAELPLTANVLELTVIPTTQPLVGRG